jgi:hypothetical protein
MTFVLFGCFLNTLYIQPKIIYLLFFPKADTPESDGGEGDQSQEPNQYEDDYEQPAEKNQESGEQVTHTVQPQAGCQGHLGCLCTKQAICLRVFT